MTRPALALAAALATTFGVAHARPVPVGRYVELPYGVSARHPWRTGQGDPQRRARSSAALPPTAPTKRWEANVGVGRVSAPAVSAEGLVYVGTQGGLAAVGPDGVVRWSVQLGLVTGTPSLLPDGAVVVGTRPGDLVVVAEGQIRWRRPLGGGVWGSPLVLDDGSVVAAAYDHAVHGVDPSGAPLFRTPVRTRIRGTVARDGERLVVPAGQGLLWLTPGGEVQRSVTLRAEIVAGPAVADDGSVWVATADGAVSAIGPRGRVLLRAESDARPSRASNLALAADGSVRLGTLDAGLVCVGPNGSVRWRHQAHGGFPAEVLVDADGAALTVAADGTMVAIEPSGEVRWEVALEGRTDASPVLAADGTIYVTTFGGTLQAWR